MSLAGIAASGISSAVNNRRMKRESDAAAAKEQAEYDARIGQSATQRAENAQLLNEYDRRSKQQIDTARNVAAITGATPEYSAAVQKGVAQGRADLVGNMAAQESSRKDALRDKKAAAVARKTAEDRATRMARNQTYSNLATNAANAFGSIVDAYSLPKADPAPVELPESQVPSAGAANPAPEQPNFTALAEQATEGLNKYAPQPSNVQFPYRNPQFS